MFVKKHGKIVTQLTTLLKKNTFMWNDATELICYALKETMCTTSLFMAMVYFARLVSLNVMPLEKAMGPC
jgi:hypothetical protein